MSPDYSALEAKVVTSVIRDLLTIIKVAMPPDLRAQDIRVKRAEDLLKQLGG